MRPSQVDALVRCNRLFMTEDSIAPGEIAHFERNIAVPAGTAAAHINQYLASVAVTP